MHSGAKLAKTRQKSGGRHDRKNRSGQSEVAQAGVQAGMSYYINATMSISPLTPF